MINVLINGCNGKMGQVLSNEIEVLDNINVICGFDKSKTGNEKFPVYSKIEEIKEKPDVIIDFSIPIATFHILEYAKTNHIPTVIATTGFSEEEIKKIEEYAKSVPIFRSSNMSYEINVMLYTVSNLAKLLSDSDIEIVETHHNRKIDSPSGTALLIADSINNALENTKYYEYNRHAKREKRSKAEIGIHSIRGGTEVGTHTVYFLGDNESFELTHTVTSRAVFAKGAIKAATYLVNQPIGLYNMNNLVQL